MTPAAIALVLVTLAAYSAIGLLIGEIERLRARLIAGSPRQMIAIYSPPSRYDEIDNVEQPGRLSAPWMWECAR